MTTPTTTAPAAITTPAAAPTAPATSSGPSVPRLRNGELRAMVARVLADHTGTGLTPRAIAHTLNRSSGAVGNACKVLADKGDAAVTSTAPLTYQATTSTAAVAAATITPAPAGAPRARRPKKTTPAPATTTATATAPASVGAGDSAAPVTGPVMRPNGMAYHPRQVAGMPDVTALRKLREAGVAALMYGPPGTGKTSVIEAAFPDLVTVQGDGDTTVADLVGEYTQTGDGRYVFVHGPLVRAMREGRTLFIDDATLIPPTVLAVVYPAMDGRRQIIIKANGGETVDAAAGFYVVAGHNPGVHGAVLTDALSSRFSAQVHVSTDYDLAAQLKVDRRAVKAARNLSTRQASGEVGWAPQLRELLAFQKIADVLGVAAAAGNLVGTAPEDDRETVSAVVRDVFGSEVAPLSLGPRI
ncbi:AAA domain (dynein-related subfamily) [Actinokineospora alba]|uniref:AAA domain (Dynein-related subfamily) n=1 Tax=Actinokineospora alba TaxID=504798 RepID=A0A1H0LDT1_9PSEU|nr:AAA family ATPase [Actinokineospora alba]TDP67284.1 dynein-related subfamily AAA family protein [Actinokineospora alba]SDJ01698.1 AAA domain (dynein-related subfamily) [Actinokineospora alba]SDO66141.1 AAA domain (dynein-related subfamily) [Actinokineospora alba]